MGRVCGSGMVGPMVLMLISQAGTCKCLYEKVNICSSEGFFITVYIVIVV